MNTMQTLTGQTLAPGTPCPHEDMQGSPRKRAKRINRTCRRAAKLLGLEAAACTLALSTGLIATDESEERIERALAGAVRMVKAAQERGTG